MSSDNAKMPASTNTVKPTSTAAVNATESKTTTVTTIKRELSASTLMSNGTAKLSSLTPARDLTLGGRGGVTAGGNKKVFLPNLNVVRNKNTNVKTSKDTTIRGRGRGRGAERGARGGGRGGRGGSTSLIQTTGVFSEGAGAVNIRPTSRSSGYSRDVDDTPSAMRKPTLLKSERKLDIKDVLAKEVDILKSLDDDNDDELEQKTDLDRIPVQLNEAKWKYLKTEIKTESVVSQEEANDNKEDAVAIASQMQALHVAQLAEQQNRPIPRYPQTLAEMLDNSQSQIFLMQLPDTLPCVEEDDDSPESSVNPSTSAEASKPANPTERKKKPVKDNVLKKMEEGQVGRLIRYKSGKTKLLLGETYFDLDMGMETGFLQDLMSISCNREERSGNMINLGPIQAKITATPDWEQLLKQTLTTDQQL
ncbi:RNA polymerase III subunit C53 isoform 1-T1 [Cochliomyia hominivorax]